MLQTSLLQEIKPLLNYLGRKRIRQLILLLILMVLVGISEVFGVASIVPFLVALTNLEQLFNDSKLQPFLGYLQINSPRRLLVFVILVFIGITVISNALRVLAIYVQNGLAARISRDLSIQVYTKIIYQPYLYYTLRHSSQISLAISYANSLAGSFFIPFLIIISNSIIVLALFISLLLIDRQVALVATLVLVGAYTVLYLWRKDRLQNNSKIMAEAGREFGQITLESIGNIKDILLGGQQSFFISAYNQVTDKTNKAQAEVQNIFLTPRYMVEAVAISAIALLALALGNRGVPVIGSFALAANRLLPAFQQIFGSLAGIQANREQVSIVVAELERSLSPLFTLPPPPPLHFTQQIDIDQVWFRYNNSDRWVLQNLTLSIPVRSRIGFVGTTGSGKSTTADLILGLLPPEKGRILLDGLPLEGERLRAWQLAIAHVPQSIFIADTSIMANIAFGVHPKEIDQERVYHAARLAQLDEFIQSLQQGYQTTVGERGIRLSGGQRQRIAIARALYRQAQVIIFDEATSALDNATEREVMNAINGLSDHLTIIMIAHRLSTIEKCDRIYEFSKGQIIHQGTYAELLEKSPSFQKMAIA